MSTAADDVQPIWTEEPDARRTGFADLVDDVTPELLVCTAAVRAGLATGCAASLMIDAEQRYVLATTDTTVAALAEAQFSVWEGPCPESVTTGEPLAVDDLTDPPDRWPRLAERVAGLRPCAVASLPIAGARGPVGVLTAYRPRAEPFTQIDRVDLAAVASALAALVATRFSVEEMTVRLPPSVLAAAVALIAAHAGIAESDALALVRTGADALGTTVGEIAEDVLAGVVPPGAFVTTTGDAVGESPG